MNFWQKTASGGKGITTMTGEQVAQYIGDAPVNKALNATYIYTATLLLDGWVAGTEAGETVWSQTAAATSIDGGPVLTANMVLISPPMTLQTGIWATDDAQSEVARIVNNGLATPGAGTVTCKVRELPDVDADIYWQGKVGYTTGEVQPNG